MKDRIELFKRQRRKDLNHKCGVYAIFVGKHTYVGSSTDLSRRLTEHRMDIPKDNRGCRVLHELYISNSKDIFYYSILEYCNPEERLLREKYYIKLLDADCNTAKDPQNPVTHCIKVYQYDNEGNFIHEYPSIQEASRQIGGIEGNISVAISQHRYAYNSLWSLKKENKYPYIPNTKLKTKKVYMLSSSLDMLQEFNSISDAARFLMLSYNEKRSFNALCGLISYYCSRNLRKNFSNYNFSFSYVYIPKENS